MADSYDCSSLYISISVAVPGKKKNKSNKRRKMSQGGQLDLKRVKLEEDDEGISDKDRNTLSRWKDMQQHTKPFIHPIRKLVRPGDMTDAAYVQQQDTVIKQQFVEIDKQQKQILEYEQIIKEQRGLISALREKHKAILAECRVAGMKLSNSLVEESVAKHSGIPSCQVTPPPTSQPPSITSHSKPILPIPAVQTHLPHPPPIPTSSSLPPASPANVFSPPMVQAAYPNISPTNRTPPPVAPPTSHTMLRAPPPPPPPLHPPVSIIPLSSSCSMEPIHSTISSTYQHPPHGPRGHMVGLPPNHTQFHQSHTAAMMMSGSGHAGHAQNHMDTAVARAAVSLGQQQQHSQPFVSRGPGKNIQSPPMLIDDLTFSPLTSGELKELEQPPGMGGPMGSTYAPPPPLVSFNEDLDSILNLSGAGYGVGIKEEDLPQSSLQIDLRYIVHNALLHANRICCSLVPQPSLSPSPYSPPPWGRG